MVVQYHGGCSVPWNGVFSTVGRFHDKCGGYLEHRGGVQYRGGYHEYHGGYLEYCWGYSVLWGIMSTVGVLNTPTVLKSQKMVFPMVLNTHSTHDIPQVHHDNTPRY